VDVLRRRRTPSRSRTSGGHALFAMQYGDEFSAAEVFEAHVDWAPLCGFRRRRRRPFSISARSASGTCRLFSASAMSSPCCRCCATTIAAFEMAIRAARSRRDRVRSRCLRRVAETGMLDDPGLAQAIQADGIDVRSISPATRRASPGRSGCDAPCR
jgi:hypothetical protein